VEKREGEIEAAKKGKKDLRLREEALTRKPLIVYE